MERENQSAGDGSATSDMDEGQDINFPIGILAVFGFFTGSKLVLKLNRWRCKRTHSPMIG